MTKKAISKKRDITPKKHALTPAMEANKWKPGESANPAGRPKGSRNKFAQAFVDDFLADWENNGKAAIETVRKDDPSTYLRVASGLLPKDFNFNMTNEGALDKLLDQLSDQQLKDLVAGLSALGASGGAEEAPKAHARNKPGSVH